MANESSEMETSVPLWLNEEFLEKAMRAEDGGGVLKVMSYKVTPATVTGDNYFSSMFRARVQASRRGHPEERSLIIKCLPEGDALQDVSHTI